MSYICILRNIYSMWEDPREENCHYLVTIFKKAFTIDVKWS